MECIRDADIHTDDCGMFFRGPGLLLKGTGKLKGSSGGDGIAHGTGYPILFHPAQGIPVRLYRHLYPFPLPVGDGD